MATLPLPSPILVRPYVSRFPPVRRPSWRHLPRHLTLGSPPRRCALLPPWEISPADQALPGDLVASSLPASEESRPDSAPASSDERPPNKRYLLQWPLWAFGPFVLLLTGMAPTLWLPLPAVFLGADIAGVLALVGLDCIFNMGATLFLLIADACAKPDGPSPSPISSVPLGYKFWNMAAGAVGFVAPVAAFLASHAGSVQPPLSVISFAVLLGPYLLLLWTQMLTEALTWHWKSPVWLMAPVVYEAYRVLQLMRGLTLAAEVAAPPWAVDTLRGLVSWWILVLGIQLMRIAWFAGNVPPAEPSPSCN